VGALFHAQRIGVTVSLAVVSPAPILDHADRCDRCGSRAYVWTILTFPSSATGELLWCRHHWLKHRDAVQTFVSVIVDESRQLFKHVEDDRGVR
jgi:hypothetical protein